MSGGYVAHWQSRPNATVVDNVPKEILFMVHEYWYKFPPMNPMWHSILGVSMCFMGILGVFGNGMVLYLMTSVKSLRTPTNMLITNLAFSDFLMMAFQFPTMAANCFAETWILGPFMCEFYAMWGSMVGNVSIMTLMCISKDRYNVIVKGMSAAPLTRKRAGSWIFLIWLYALAWTLAPFFGWGRYVPEGNMTSCSLDYLTKELWNSSYTIVYGCFVYFLPLTVIIYSYFFIVLTVARHEKSLKEQAKKMNVASLKANADTNKQSAETKLAKIAMVTVSLWFIAWTPYLVTAWYGILGNTGNKLTPLSTIWASVFAKSASIYNPLVYAISHPKYKQALLKKFPSLACTSEPDTDTRSEMTAATRVTNKVAPEDDIPISTVENSVT